MSLGIRVNTTKISPKKLINRLKARGFEFERLNFCDYCFRVIESPFSISSTIEYLLGYFYIQDPTSMVPPLWLDLKKEDVVLDMCAAPGGKATHIAQFSTVIAVDKSVKRMRALKSNFIRMGLSNYIAYRMNILRFSGLKFDKILLDAPCTGSGISGEVEVEYALKFQEVQKSLVKKAYELLNESGILVYSTCSIMKEENEDVIDWARRYFKVLKMKKFEKGIDQGFFVAKLKK